MNACATKGSTPKTILFTCCNKIERIKVTTNKIDKLVCNHCTKIGAGQLAVVGC